MKNILDGRGALEEDLKLRLLRQVHVLAAEVLPTHVHVSQKTLGLLLVLEVESRPFLRVLKG